LLLLFPLKRSYLQNEQGISGESVEKKGGGIFWGWTGRIFQKRGLCKAFTYQNGSEQADERVFEIDWFEASL